MNYVILGANMVTRNDNFIKYDIGNDDPMI